MFNCTPVFNAIHKSSAKVIVLQGGTSSSKSISALQELIVYAIFNKDKVCTITGESIPNLKKGAYRDVEWLYSITPFFQQQVLFWNKSERIIHLKSGSVIEFISNLDEQSAKSGKRDRLYVDEANGIPWAIFFQLAIRTRDKIVISYNPSAPFWAHEKLIGTTPAGNDLSAIVELIISDHRHNTFLTQDEHDKIEGIKDPELWKVYARGITGNLSGLIFPNWKMIPESKFPWKQDGNFGGVDYGYTCFYGETMITTDRGDVPINKINIGDMVLTRNGYRKVINVFDNGIKEVTDKTYGFDFGYINILATYDHRFNVDNKWKKHGEIIKGETLCVLSSLTAKNTNDTHRANIPITTLENGKRAVCTTLKDYMLQFTNITTGLSLKVKSFIILTGTLLTTTSIIWSLSLFRGTLSFMKCLKNTVRRTNQSQDSIKQIGSVDAVSFLRTLKTKLGHVNHANLNSKQPTHTKDFAAENAIINGSILQKNWMLRQDAIIALKFLWGINTLNRSLAVKNVRINYRSLIATETNQKIFTQVYDLQIDGVNEYFANGILVHNCDPTAAVIMNRIGNSIYVHEICYETGLTPQRISTLFKSHGFDEETPIYSEHDGDMIRQLRMDPFNLLVIAARKGPGSIKAGISKIGEYEMFFTDSSKNIDFERKKYMWMRDPDTGKFINTPSPGEDHLLDAIRYGVYSHFYRSA